MMRFWKHRQARKEARELLKVSRKLMRMNRDIMSAKRIEEITEACDELEAAIKAKDYSAMAAHSGKLDDLLARQFPKGKHSWLIENVEVFLVAVIVAMGVRTFFIQPFKIPTGSMQPTLFGIYPPPPDPRQSPVPEKNKPKPYLHGEPSLLEKIIGTVWSGTMYEGEGYRRRGDHIFVDRFTYHFRKPKRGEVVVFTTQNIDDIPEESRGKFYIKRLIGVGGDTVQIAPPYININGERLTGTAFDRIYSMENMYNGYVLPDGSQFFGAPVPHMSMRKPIYKVPDKNLFVLGDNSRSSLDGRYWGSVPERDLVGRAFMVYWPFTKRFGPID